VNQLEKENDELRTIVDKLITKAMGKKAEKAPPQDNPASSAKKPIMKKALTTVPTDRESGAKDRSNILLLLVLLLEFVSIYDGSPYTKEELEGVSDWVLERLKKKNNEAN
jgi:hypothetical protein